MANKLKIVGEIETIVRDLALKGYNASYIAKQVKLKKETVQLWAKKNDIVLTKRSSSVETEMANSILELLKEGKTMKEIQRELSVHYDLVKRIAVKNNIELRSYKQSALERTLSLEEANSRLPEGHGKVVGYNQEEKKYIIIADDGFVYKKKSSKIRQGDPRGKSGFKHND